MPKSDRDIRAMNLRAIDTAVANGKQSVRLCMRSGSVSALLRIPLRPGQNFPEDSRLVYVCKAGGTIHWQRKGWWVLKSDISVADFVQVVENLKRRWLAEDNPPRPIPPEKPTELQRMIAKKHITLAKRILSKHR